MSSDKSVKPTQPTTRPTVGKTAESEYKGPTPNKPTPTKQGK
ncbi:hypothetical protein [Aliarcobacter faecis]|nr:hypothetical protein [Aliarcobacter faecis]